MSEDSGVDLSGIYHELNSISWHIESLAGKVDSIDANVSRVNSRVSAIASDVQRLDELFNDYVKTAEKRHNLSIAQTLIVSIQQELETKFGYYAKTRRIIIGILQANDLEIVSRNTLTSATEDLMLSAPGYWLAPAVVSLAAWINDNQKLADRALRESILRDDAKTSLLFALICRRFERKDSSLRWVKRYLDAQDEQDLDRKTVIVIDALASGLLGADTEGTALKQLNEWISRLQDKPGFIERQINQWSDEINKKRQSLVGGYEYLRKYSNSWSKLQYIMEGARLHAVILSFFEDIFNQDASEDELNKQLDDMLFNLVSEFDNEELPLRRRERYNQLIIDHDGDEDSANQALQDEQTAFDERKDFTQLLTDAAMKPQLLHVSVYAQKFSIAFCRNWIINAYKDITAKNRLEIPTDVEINIDKFNESSQDGTNEAELIEKWEKTMKDEMDDQLAKTVLTDFQSFCLFGGWVAAGIGLFLMIGAMFGLGFFAAVSSIVMFVIYSSGKSSVEKRRASIEKQSQEKFKNGSEIIRASLAELVDFRAQFAQKDSESQKVVDFLELIKPEHYVNRLAASTRRIITSD